MKKFAIKTLGCKTNQLESATIQDTLLQKGYQLVKFAEVADYYIINTCSVTAKSDSESAYYIRKAKKTNPNAKIIATGCYIQLKPDESEANLIVGNANKLDIVDFIDKNTSLVTDIMDEKEFKDKLTFSTEGKTRANVKIQDGCNSRCSYCIIPYARGYSRSNEAKNVIKQIEVLTQKGFKEIILTGIHIGQWGLDFKEKSNLLSLLREIEKIESLERYRLGSLEPPEITDELIDFLGESKKFAHHLHISVQNGNNEILKLMNRKYSVADMQDIMQKLKIKIPKISLGCDVIVGFPTETQEQFQDSYENLKALPLSYIHVFPYSIRPGTPAAKMEQVDETIKKDRAKKLRTLAANKKSEFINSLIGKELEVLIEKTRHKTGKLKGICSNFIPVLLNGDDNLANQIIKAKILSYEDGIATAKVVAKVGGTEL